MTSLKLQNWAIRWRTAWRFQIFLMAIHLFHFSFCTCCTKNCYVLHRKTMLCQQVNVSYRSYLAHQNYVSHKKICCGNKKSCDTQKERPKCWLNMFSVAQKRVTCRQKIVPVVYKYMLYWLKKFCVAQKILWCRTKIKFGVKCC